MENRTCLYCSNPIPSEKRADSKFCSNSCKAKHWEEKPQVNNPEQKAIEKPNPQPEGLRGIIDSNPGNKNPGSDVSLTSILPKNTVFPGSGTKVGE